MPHLDMTQRTPRGRSTATAVIYVRLASTAADDQEAIAAQRAACRACAKRLDATVLHEYTDHGVAARDSHRPALQDMLADIAEHATDYLICTDLSRLSRKHADFVDVALQAHACGTRVVLASTNTVLALHVGNPPTDQREAA